MLALLLFVLAVSANTFQETLKQAQKCSKASHKLAQHIQGRDLRRLVCDGMSSLHSSIKQLGKKFARVQKKLAAVQDFLEQLATEDADMRKRGRKRTEYLKTRKETSDKALIEKSIAKIKRRLARNEVRREKAQTRSTKYEGLLDGGLGRLAPLMRRACASRQSLDYYLQIPTANIFRKDRKRTRAKAAYVETAAVLGLITYAEAQQLIPRQPMEDTLERRFVMNILADKTMGSMRKDERKIVEGAESGPIVYGLLMLTLQFVESQVFHTLPKASKAEVGELMAQLSQLHVTAFLHGLRNRTDNAVFGEMLFRAMRLGETMVMTAGTENHALSAIVRRDSVNAYGVQMVNTGNGLRKLHQRRADGRYLIYRTYRNVPLAEIVRRHYLNNYKAPGVELVYPANAYYVPAVSLETLPGTRFAQQQQSGTCSARAVFAVLRCTLSLETFAVWRTAVEVSMINSLVRMYLVGRGLRDTLVAGAWTVVLRNCMEAARRRVCGLQRMGGWGRRRCWCRRCI